MGSTENSSPFGRRQGGMESSMRPAGDENTIKTQMIQIERKTFVFSLRENPRGCFLRITEDVRGRRDAIIVPAPGLNDFRRAVEEMTLAAAARPAANPPPRE